MPATLQGDHPGDQDGKELPKPYLFLGRVPIKSMLGFVVSKKLPQGGLWYFKVHLRP